jgi:3-isopropylmalate dehydrogenase
LYEPIHGSAPDIAGKAIANPCGTVLSVALLLRHSLALEEEARAVEKAVFDVLESGVRTPDIAAPGARAVSTSEMGEAVVARLNAR